MWRELRAELATAVDLLPLPETGNVRREWATGRDGGPLVLASDASPSGGGVVQTEAAPEGMADLLT